MAHNPWQGRRLLGGGGGVGLLLGHRRLCFGPCSAVFLRPCIHFSVLLM